MTNMRIFEVRSDFERFPDGWFLDEPLTEEGHEIDARDFTSGTTYRGPRPATLPVATPGKEFGFCFGAFDMPVVSRHVAEAIVRAAKTDVELFPVEIKGANTTYYILNATISIDCLDEDHSEFTRWTTADHRLDLVGQYRMISTIRVDPRATDPHHVFRISNWPTALLVSEAVRDVLINIPDLGVSFAPASE